MIDLNALVKDQVGRAVLDGAFVALKRQGLTPMVKHGEDVIVLDPAAITFAEVQAQPGLPALPAPEPPLTPPEVVPPEVTSPSETPPGGQGKPPRGSKRAKTSKKKSAPKAASPAPKGSPQWKAKQRLYQTNWRRRQKKLPPLTFEEMEKRQAKGLPLDSDSD